MKIKNILWQLIQLKLKDTAVNNLELPISKTNAEVLKMYAAQLKPLLTYVNCLWKGVRQLMIIQLEEMEKLV